MIQFYQNIIKTQITEYNNRMGQVLRESMPASLIKQPQKVNCQPAHKQHCLKMIPEIKVPFYQVVFKKQDEEQVELVYKFMDNKYISVQLTKKKDSYTNYLIPYLMNGENIYGYKVKYRNKTSERVKFLLFKKRIQGDNQYIFDILAEMKLLSTLRKGPYMGTVINGSDGYLMNGYAQYYSQNLYFYESDSQYRKLMIGLKETFPNFSLKHVNKGYSMCYRVLVLRYQLKVTSQITYIEQKKGTQFFMNQKSDNTCLIDIQHQNLKQMQTIDQKTGMLSAIQNHLINKNIQKVITTYQQALYKKNNAKDRLNFFYSVLEIFSDCIYFKSYQHQIVNQCLKDQQVTKLSSDRQKKWLRQLSDKYNLLTLQNQQFDSQNQIEQYSQTHSLSDSQVQKQKLRLNIQDSNKNRVRQIIKQMNIRTRGREEFNEQVSFQYAVMLMNSGKSRLALNCFEFLLRSDIVSSFLKYRICSYMGLILYHRSSYKLARKQFEKSITKMIRMRYYSAPLIRGFNNLGCTLFQEQKYENALKIFQYSLQKRIQKNGYEAILKNNRAITYLKLGMQKEAKNQFHQIVNVLNQGQPINNAVIIYKLYNNTGYMNMKNKQYNSALKDFQFAISLQQNCLIPNGYRPSPYLHNNMIMTLYKLKRNRQAIDHFTKYFNEFDQLKLIEKVFLNYNLACIHNQLFQCQTATQYIQKCRRIICTLPEKYRSEYQNKIIAQAERFNRRNIDQLSEQQHSRSLVSLFSTNSKRIDYKDQSISFRHPNSNGSTKTQLPIKKQYQQEEQQQQHSQTNQKFKQKQTTNQIQFQ